MPEALAGVAALADGAPPSLIGAGAVVAAGGVEHDLGTDLVETSLSVVTLIGLYS